MNEIDLKVRGLDRSAMAKAKERWDRVAKPLESLGVFEAMVIRIAGIQGTPDIALKPRCCLVFCADHGVVEEGVTQTDSSVTAKVALSICEGTSNISLMAAQAQAQVLAIDMGMKTQVRHPALISKRVRPGTRNMTKGPALLLQEGRQAFLSGMEAARDVYDRGFRLMAVGEMGIGNTTAAAAAAAALTGLAPEGLVGRGAGLSDEGLERKRRAVKEALLVNRPDPGDALNVLCKVGGLELLGMAGAFVGAAACGMTAVIDGAVSAVSALAAVRLCPDVKEVLLASHRSREPLMQAVLEALGMHPVLDAGMALGEGTGAVMLFPLLDMAERVYGGCHTFSSLDMPAYVPQGERT